MQYRNISKSNSNNNNDLVGSLEEFGLSKYEARAYLTMIGKGSLAASEIAYYANLPRTKVYPTLKKLEKKRLSIISQKKPVISSAIPPNDAFGEIVNLHERRVKNMKKIVDKLQKISEEGRKPKGSEEKRYFVFDPNLVFEKIENLICRSRSSINAILDAWGLRLISQCKSSLIRAITNGVKIRLVLSSQSIDNDIFSSLPAEIHMKIGNLSYNIILIDSNNIISIDSSNGKAAVFSSIDVFGLSYIRNFENEWKNAMQINHSIDTDPSIAGIAIQLAKLIQNGLSMCILDHTTNSQADLGTHIIRSIEKSGLKIFETNINELFNIIDSALKIGYSGNLKHDKTNNVISIHSKTDSKSVLPWALLLTSYFERIGYESKIMQNSKQITSNETIHLKLSKPIPELNQKISSH
jgi:HTH-type transcriptional regulator, sugar sensing transcriptional regulator